MVMIRGSSLIFVEDPSGVPDLTARGIKQPWLMNAVVRSGCFQETGYFMMVPPSEKMEIVLKEDGFFRRTWVPTYECFALL